MCAWDLAKSRKTGESALARGVHPSVPDRVETGGFVMRLHIGSLWVFALVLAAAGCNEVTDPSSVAAIMRVVEYQGEDNDVPPIETNNPGLPALEGVEVCENNTTNCDRTNADGQATLQLPIQQEVSYTLTKNGYASNLQAEVTDPADVGTGTNQTISPKITMWSDELRSNWFERLSSPYPQRGTGTIYVFMNPAIEGVTFELIGATGTAFYETALDDPRLDLEATTSMGTGGFVEVGPGDFQIEFSGAVSRCLPVRAWAGSAKNRIRVPVQAGYITVASVACSHQP